MHIIVFLLYEGGHLNRWNHQYISSLALVDRSTSSLLQKYRDLHRFRGRMRRIHSVLNSLGLWNIIQEGECCIHPQYTLTFSIYHIFTKEGNIDEQSRRMVGYGVHVRKRNQILYWPCISSSLTALADKENSVFELKSWMISRDGFILMN